MKNTIPLLSIFSVAALVMTAVPTAFAEAASNEPDKSMTAAHESFLKGDMQKASESIDKAAASVNDESEKVAASAKDGVKKAGDELANLGKRVKNGEVKSDNELKRTFARVD